MDQARIHRRSFWRFSLRELLLLMLAVSAFLGWGTVLYRQWKFEPTPFYVNGENWQQEVMAIYKELDEPGFEEAHGRNIERNGTSSTSRTIVFRVPLSATKRKPFLDAFEARVQEKLTAHQCRVGGGSLGGGDKDLRVFLYNRGAVAGAFEVWMRDIGDGKVDLTVEMHEERGRLFSISVSNH